MGRAVFAAARVSDSRYGWRLSLRERGGLFAGHLLVQYEIIEAGFLIMLTIRSHQIKVFESCRRDNFVDRLLVIAADCWPATFHRLGRNRVRELLIGSLADTEEFGLSTEREAGRYVNLVLALGERFYELPRFEWAAKILGAPNIYSGTKIDLVIRRCGKLLDSLGELDGRR